MVDGSLVNIHDEISVPECVKGGADVVCFSGDKLLGGPQAGIIVGRKKYIDAMKKHQLARALRIDKMTLAALEATLRIYLDPDRVFKEIPTLANLAASKADLRMRAKKLSNMLPALKDDYSVAVKSSEAQVGGGSAPGELLESSVVQITPLSKSATELEKALREYDTPIIARIQKGSVLIDPRTVSDMQFKEIARAFTYIFGIKK
jgi:L-seryl-tRNA(Ser) seleniumtransferase